MLAEGESTRGIAERLNYSERTVKNIVRDLLDKLQLQDQGSRRRAGRAPRGDLNRLGAGRVSGRVAVIGLDCAEPRLVFDRWREELPNLSRLMSAGTWGPLASVDPPITVPAWSCMMTGRDPGELGIYGFRNRSAYDYRSMSVADSSAVGSIVSGITSRGRAST